MSDASHYHAELAQRGQTIIDDFARFDDWDERYQHLIALGKALPAMDEAQKTDKHKVQGCQSQVWMHASLTTDDQGQALIAYQADSDALIVRGLVALLLRYYDRLPAPLIMQNPPTFFESIGLDKHLSMQRSNGLAAMLKQMKLYAMAFHMASQQA